MSFGCFYLFVNKGSCCPFSMKPVASPKQTLALLSKATPTICTVLSLFLQSNKICIEMRVGMQDGER